MWKLKPAFSYAAGRFEARFTARAERRALFSVGGGQRAGGHLRLDEVE
jgi:hypothetical protein